MSFVTFLYARHTLRGEVGGDVDVWILKLGGHHLLGDSCAEAFRSIMKNTHT